VKNKLFTDQPQTPTVPQKLMERSNGDNVPKVIPANRLNRIPDNAPKFTTRFTRDFFLTLKDAPEYNIRNTDAAISSETLPIIGIRPPY